MEREEVKQVLKESIIKFDSPFSAVACRGRISRAVAEKKIKPILSEADWKVFLETLEVEYLLYVTDFLATSEPFNKLVIAELVDKLKILFDKWQRLLEFMIDNYDKLPSRIKRVINQETLVRDAAYIYAAKEDLWQKIESGGAAKFVSSISEPAATLLARVRMFLLGREGPSDEKYREFIIEVRDAFAVAKALRQEKKP